MTSLFSKECLTEIFHYADKEDIIFDENAERIFQLKDQYINTIDNVISFLQGNQPTLAYKICERNYLPEASKFDNLDELDFSFGNLGIP